jgi:hypothetical protein
VDPNENQPGGSSGRTITLRLTRDRLILIAALVFLGIAVLLAWLFPSAGPGVPTPSGTSVAQGETAPTAPRATSLAFIPSPPAGTTLAPSAAPTVPEQPGGYPQPQTLPPAGPDTSAEPTAVGEPDQTEGAPELSPASTGLPTFAPARPTSTFGAAASTPAGGVFQQGTAYPPPGGATETPTENLLNPPTVTPSPEPTFGARPTSTLQPTSALQPTRTPRPPAPTTPPRPRPTPAPTAIPIDVLRGNRRWTPANGPIILRRDQRLVAGATLIIEPGTEVRLAPGVSFFVEGTLYALGQPGRPVRFVGSEAQRWDGLFGRPGSNIALEYTDIQGGGAGGTVLISEGGNLVLHNDHVNNNGGHIAVNDSRLEMRDSEIAGNDMPYGAALEASYENGGFVILTGNRIGGNRMAAGAAPVQINNRSSVDAVNLDLQRNLLIGQTGPDLVLFQDGPFLGGLDVTLPNDGPFLGGMTCNTLINGANGLNIRTNTTQVPPLRLNARDNAFEDHTPPIIPIYLKYGIGRGATSAMEINMSNNWWDSPLGPYEPDRHADGRGDAVGDTITFVPWLTARPACAPRP